MTVYAIADALICPLGNDTKTVYKNMKSGAHQLSMHQTAEGQSYVASKMEETQNCNLSKRFTGKDYTRFEQLCIGAACDALARTNVDAGAKDTIIILSSTKGNIEFVGKNPEKATLLSSAKKIAAHFNNPNEVICISIACISGSVAQIVAKRMLDEGLYQNAIVIGCDTVSDFVLAGFASFQALADAECRPFDAARKGLNLGEAAACMILSNTKTENSFAALTGGSVTNDANHLSGPSKTGEELGWAIGAALKEAGLQHGDIDYICAHGTATPYNDEMESKAFHIANIAQACINSLKSYTGHTLGASGLLETIIALQEMKDNTILPSRNFEKSNLPQPINVTSILTETKINHFIKTAAGFGGCNAAIIWSKI